MASTAAIAAKFMADVRSSGLVPAGQLDAAIDSLSPQDCNAAPALAAALIRTGALTPFQARKLLGGVSKGLVLGAYHILAPLGQGGMGKVYLAKDSRTGQPVALKVLPPRWAREQDRLLVRFQREMEMSHSVNHPNLARTYETGVHGDVHFIALEYVPGRTLWKVVSTQGPLEPDIAARIFAEGADALAHAHERGLIHRDVKPSNLMITPAGHAKLLDLGLALREGEAGDARVIGGRGIVVGTMEYVPPEQTRNAAAVDARSDLYGLGATLFYALTGRPPFPGGTAIDKIHRHRGELPPRVEEYNAAVPEGLADLIDELMAKDPNERPDSALKARDKLRKWAAPPAPPDAPFDIPRILKALATNPTPEADTDAPPLVVERNWPLYILISGAFLLLVALVVLLLVLFSR